MSPGFHRQHHCPKLLSLSDISLFPWGSSFQSLSRNLGFNFLVLLCTSAILPVWEGPSCRKEEREKKETISAPYSWNHKYTEQRWRFPSTRVLVPAATVTIELLGWPNGKTQTNFLANPILGDWKEKEQRKLKIYPYEGFSHSLWTLGVPFPSPLTITRGLLLEVSFSVLWCHFNSLTSDWKILVEKKMVNVPPNWGYFKF